MRPTRATQPLRKGARVPSDALRAAMRGRTFSGQNPADINRMAGKLASAGRKRSKRPARPARPQRPSR